MPGLFPNKGEIYAFTDGSSSRKTNCIGSGFIVYKNDIALESFDIGFSNCGRNGAAELVGMIFCLDMLIPYKEEKITIYSDSQYVVNSFDWIGNWVIKDFFLVKNLELILVMIFLRLSFKNLEIKWIKGHSGSQDIYSKGNDEADRLSTQYKVKKSK